MYYHVYLAIGVVHTLIMFFHVYRTLPKKRIRLAKEFGKDDTLPPVGEVFDVLRERRRWSVLFFGVFFMFALSIISAMLYTAFWPIYLLAYAYVAFRKHVIDLVIKTMEEIINSSLN
jgi:hypothetical protein